MYQLNQQAIACVAGGINNPRGCIPDLPIMEPFPNTGPETPDYPESWPYVPVSGGTILPPEEFDLQQ